MRADNCAVCGGPFGTVVYLLQDKVTEEKKQVCYNCTLLASRCYLCGMPVAVKETKLPDGRILCAREATTAVLEQSEGASIWSDTKDNLDRLFSRFLSFPQTNVSFSMVDRVKLQQLFKFAGHDAECPNVWGCMQTHGEEGDFQHEINVLSALPRDGFKSTCAHEYTHAWLNENLNDKRKQTLARDAVEGFCELVSYLLMDAQQEEAQKKLIQLNAYTRGQFQLFLEAEKQFGFDDVADWMKSGSDARLMADDLGRVRQLEDPAKTTASAGTLPIYSRPVLSPAPKVLTLKGILWSKEKPSAIINDRSFYVKEEGKVRLGETNIVIRCLSITEDSVRVQIVGSGKELVLRLKNDGRF